MINEVCTYCGRKGHWRPDCPEIALLQRRYPSVYNSSSGNVGQLVDPGAPVVKIQIKPATPMKQVRVEKAKLLAIIRKNRAEHRDIFLQSQRQFRVVAIKTLDEQLKFARKGKPFELAKLAVLEAPQDHTEQYDRAIQMLEMSVDEHILVDEREFQNYVQDKWNWSRNWASNNMRYTDKSSRYYGKLSSLSSDE